jgi:hypothetical protein
VSLMPYTVRPIDPLTPWPNRRRPGDHERSRFRASWSDTLNRLDREIFQLVPWSKRTWVLQMDVSDSQIRRDGGVYARATPATPAVRVAFETKNGPLLYSCDRYTTWQDNARAIALTLEALRAVTRYGVADADEQYRGWTAIGNRPAEMTRDQAAEFIAHWAGFSASEPSIVRDAVLNDIPAFYRAAAKRAHPDITGDDGDTMARLNAARALLLNGRAT